jgi:multimeric flavodoxin WrbA
MNVLAIVGSPRKGKATDQLIDRAIEGYRSKSPECAVSKIHLMDHQLGFCRNCLACRDSETDGPYAKCVIRDDMDWISEELARADRLIIGTPVHEGYCTGIMTTFLERVTWTFAKPTGRALTLTKCPVPRAAGKQKKAVIIVVSGLVPPYYRMFCDDATAHIKIALTCSLNAKPVGDMYAGAVESRGVEYYFGKARKLGLKLL